MSPTSPVTLGQVEPDNTASGGIQKNIDAKKIGEEPPADKTVVVKTLSEIQWAALNSQRDRLITFMIITFGCLNVAMIGIVVYAMNLDQSNLAEVKLSFKAADRIIGSTVINALIAATVAQAGLAFITITKFLFPAGKEEP